MKFINALNKALTENSVLKWCVTVLAVTIAVMSILLVKLAVKDPLVVERACESKVLSKVGSQPTKEELEAFVREALPERFDSSLAAQRYTTDRLWAFKKQETKELSQRQLRQRIIINSIEVGDKQIKADVDRLIAVGEIRSAFKFPLALKVETVTRSPANPYGLLLTDATPIEEQHEKK